MHTFFQSKLKIYEHIRDEGPNEGLLFECHSLFFNVPEKYFSKMFFFLFCLQWLGKYSKKIMSNSQNFNISNFFKLLYDTPEVERIIEDIPKNSSKVLGLCEIPAIVLKNYVPEVASILSRLPQIP